MTKEQAALAKAFLDAAVRDVKMNLVEASKILQAVTSLVIHLSAVADGKMTCEFKPIEEEDKFVVVPKTNGAKHHEQIDAP